MARIAERGFTMIEMVAVIVIIGILAALALPRTSDSGLNERALQDQTVIALRYAQKTAIAARRTVCVSFSSTGLSATILAYGVSDCSTGSTLSGPDGNPLVVSAQGSASFSGTPGTLIFDSQGAVANTSVINVANGGSITVEGVTGYVH